MSPRKPEGVVLTMGEWAKNRPGLKVAEVEEFPFVEDDFEPVSKICQNLTEWVSEAWARSEAGHTLHPADSARNLMVGYVDEKTNEELLLPMRVLKSASDDELAALNINRSDLASARERAKTLGTDDFFLWTGPADDWSEPVQELEEAWLHVRESNDVAGEE